MYATKGKIYPAYVSKNSSNCKKQGILLMTPIGQGWEFLKLLKMVH